MNRRPDTLRNGWFGKMDAHPGFTLYTKPQLYQSGCSPKNFSSNHPCYFINSAPQPAATTFAFSSVRFFLYAHVSSILTSTYSILVHLALDRSTCWPIRARVSPHYQKGSQVALHHAPPWIMKCLVNRRFFFSTPDILLTANNFSQINISVINSSPFLFFCTQKLSYYV